MSLPQAGKGALAFIFITLLVDATGFGIILPVMPHLIMHLTGVGIDRAAAYSGGLGFVYALMLFFCAPVLGNLSDAFGRRPVLLFALGALGCDYFIQGFAPTIGWLFFGRAVAGMAGASFTPGYAYVADITEPAKRAQSFGLMGAAFGLGFIVGPAIGGLLGTLGIRAPFFAAGSLALINTVFGYFALPESLPRANRRAFHWRRANPLATLKHVGRFPVMRWLLGAIFLWQLGHQVLPSIWSFYTISKFGWSQTADRPVAHLGGHDHGGRAGAADARAHSVAGRRATGGARGDGGGAGGLSRLCAGDRRLDDVRGGPQHVHLRAQLSFDERDRLPAGAAGRAGGIAGRHRLPLQPERHPGSAADDPDLPLLFRRHRAGAFPRGAVCRGRGTDARQRDAVGARPAARAAGCERSAARAEE